MAGVTEGKEERGKERGREGERGEEGKSEESNNSDNLVGFISHATDRPTEGDRNRRQASSPAKKTTLGDKDAEGGRGRKDNRDARSPYRDGKKGM